MNYKKTTFIFIIFPIIALFFVTEKENKAMSYVKKKCFWLSSDDYKMLRKSAVDTLQEYVLEINKAISQGLLNQGSIEPSGERIGKRFFIADTAKKTILDEIPCIVSSFTTPFPAIRSLIINSKGYNIDSTRFLDIYNYGQENEYYIKLGVIRTLKIKDDKDSICNNIERYKHRVFTFKAIRNQYVWNIKIDSVFVTKDEKNSFREDTLRIKDFKVPIVDKVILKYANSNRNYYLCDEIKVIYKPNFIRRLNSDTINSISSAYQLDYIKKYLKLKYEFNGIVKDLDSNKVHVADGFITWKIKLEGINMKDSKQIFSISNQTNKLDFTLLKSRISRFSGKHKSKGTRKKEKKFSDIQVNFILETNSTKEMPWYALYRSDNTKIIDWRKNHGEDTPDNVYLKTTDLNITDTTNYSYFLQIKTYFFNKNKRDSLEFSTPLFSIGRQKKKGKNNMGNYYFSSISSGQDCD